MRSRRPTDHDHRRADIPLRGTGITTAHRAPALGKGGSEPKALRSVAQGTAQLPAWTSVGRDGRHSSPSSTCLGQGALKAEEWAVESRNVVCLDLD
jgi:hypothetical protein